MMHPRVTSITFVTSLLLLAPAGLRADEITLKNGKKHGGYVISESDRSVRFLNAQGRETTFRRDEVSSIVKSPEIGVPQVDEKLAGIAESDASAFGELAAWAKDQKLEAWRCLAKRALMLDDEQAKAHELLGHTFAVDRWFENEKDAKVYEKKKREDDLKARGFQKYKDGWVHKDQLAELRKDESSFVLEPTTLEWKSRAELGYVKRGTTWVRMTGEDLRDAENFKNLMGEEITPITTEHFRLFVMQYPPERVEEFSLLAEKTYAWFLTTMGKAPDFPLFQGNKGHIWIFKDSNASREWFKHYRNRYSLGESFEKLLMRGGGNIHTGRGLLACIVPDQNDDIRNRLVHMVGHQLIEWFSPGLEGNAPDWLSEAFAHSCEQAMLGNGVSNCSTLSQYAKDGGIADKKFTTRDAPDRAKGLIRRREAKDFVSLNKTDLNSLNGDDLTKGWTLISWLLETRRDELIQWLERANTADRLQALKATLGWDPAELDKNWEDHWDR